MATEREIKVPWLLGIMILPFLLAFVVAVTVFTFATVLVTTVGAALVGRLTITLKGK